MSIIQDKILKNKDDIGINFLEGIAYNKNSCVSIKAKFINENEKNEILNNPTDPVQSFFGGKMAEVCIYINTQVCMFMNIYLS
jgi:hypothetical protein